MMKQLIRKIVPRAIRNYLRRPSVSMKRIVPKTSALLGRIDMVSLLDGISVRCHPICSEGFSVFTPQPDQRLEMQEIAGQCKLGMRFVDVGSHKGRIYRGSATSRRIPSYSALH